MQEEMNQEEMQRFLNREAERGSSEYEALKALLWCDALEGFAHAPPFVHCLFIQSSISNAVGFSSLWVALSPFFDNLLLVWSATTNNIFSHLLF